MAGNAKPKHIADVLDRAILFSGIKAKFDQYSLVPNWAEIVGSDLASVSLPEKIVRGKTLVVRVLDSSWAQEMEFRKVAIIERIFQLKRGALIEDLKFVIGGPKDFQRNE